MVKKTPSSEREPLITPEHAERILEEKPAAAAPEIKKEAPPEEDIQKIRAQMAQIPETTLPPKEEELKQIEIPAVAEKKVEEALAQNASPEALEHLI